MRRVAFAGLLPVFSFFWAVFSASAQTQVAAGDAAAPAAVRSPFVPVRSPERPRSDLWMPMVNLLLPGFDQWWEGQYPYAAAYTGVYLGGQLYASTVAARNDLEGQMSRRREEKRARGEDESDVTIDAKDITVRKYLLGQLLAQGASGMSAWHAFRTAAESRRAGGQYGFLATTETPADVLLAPFAFHHLRESTTLIPLGVAAALSGLILASEPPEGTERAAFTGADGVFTAAYSWNAGTHEEALFRGWLMPVMYEYWDNGFVANLVQSVLFAAAHLGTNPQPIPQLFLGYHLGYVSQKRRWTLSEAVFIHTWWDVIAFGIAYHYKQSEPEPLAHATPPRLPNPVLWLPPLWINF
jgi:membrane protease YdiL (CAAX protease family)